MLAGEGNQNGPNIANVRDVIVHNNNYNVYILCITALLVVVISILTPPLMVKLFQQDTTCINNAEPPKPIHELWFRLVKYYKSEACWMDPFPWDQSRRKQDSDSFYVSLTLDRYDRTGIRMKSQAAEVDSLFDPVKKGAKRSERILVRGEPGSGKSTLCKKFCCDWSYALNTFRSLSSIHILPVIYSLRRLPSCSNIENELLNFIYSFICQEKVSFEQFKRLLSVMGRNLTIVLDGYDEINEIQKEQVRNLLKDSGESVFRQSSFLVTSRHKEEKDFLELFEKHYSIRKMSERSALQLVIRFYENNKTDVLKMLNTYHPRTLIDLSPLKILMLSWITKEKRDKDYRMNEHLVFDCIYQLAVKYNERESLQLSHRQIQWMLWVSGFVMLTNRFSYMKPSDLNEVFLKNQDFLVRLGIVKIVIDDNRVFYEPVHKLFWDSLVEHCKKTFEENFLKLLNCNNDDDLCSLASWSSRQIPLSINFQMRKNKSHELYLNINFPGFGLSGICWKAAEKLVPTRSCYNICNKNFTIITFYGDAVKFRAISEILCPVKNCTDKFDTFLIQTEKYFARHPIFEMVITTDYLMEKLSSNLYQLVQLLDGRAHV